MKWRMRIGIFVGVLALALAATAPARAFLHTRNAGDVVIGSVEGSIWQPVLRGVKVGAFDAGDVRLSLSAADLLVGRIAADARIDGQDLTGDGRVEFGFGGTMRLQANDLVATVREGSLAAASLPAGSMRMTGVDIRFVGRKCASAQGQVTSDMVSVAMERVGQAGLPLAGEVRCSGDAARLALGGERDNDVAEAWLDLRGDGIGEWSAVYTTDNQELAVLLMASGFAPRDSPGSFASKGRVQWLPL